MDNISMLIYKQEYNAIQCILNLCVYLAVNGLNRIFLQTESVLR